tara:strand:+ start:190 stop:294 length:105 start_codon:yes stop_codon:yes gene_type:complete
VRILKVESGAGVRKFKVDEKEPIFLTSAQGAALL